MTKSDAQDDRKHNWETVIHTSNGNETVTNISNGDFEQMFLSKRTIPVFVLTISPKINQRVALIVMAPHMLLAPATKEDVADTELGGAWINRTPWQVSRAGVNGRTPENIRNSVSII